MNQLKKFFSPATVAVIGASATPGKVGNDIVLNLKKNFKGTIYPINPKEKVIEGLAVFSSVLKTPKIPELAIIVVPAIAVLSVTEECAKRGCKNFVIISAGFKESGEAGEKLEAELLEIKKKYNLRILGPNCLGYLSSHNAVNASFAGQLPLVGNVSFLSQSGALGTAVLDMAVAQGLGISYFVSLGNKMDISEGDLLDYFYQDKSSSVILAYLESVENGRKFLDQASIITKKKPIIVLKAGKTEAGIRAISSHTGSLAGASEIYSTAFKQSGVIEADDLDDFFNLAKAFSWQKLPKGNRVAVLTNAGGPGILLTDFLPRYGMVLADLPSSIINKLKKILPPASNTHNPVDILGDASANRYAESFKLLLEDKSNDAIIVVLTPQKMTEIELTAKYIGEACKKTSKTIILCFLGDASITPKRQVFAKYHLPYFNNLSSAVKVLGLMRQQAIWREQKIKVIKKKATSQKNKIITKTKAGMLTEDEGRDLLKNFDFPLHRAELINSSDDIKQVAKKIGYPLALKVVSPDIIHKSEIGGVALNLNNEADVVLAWQTMQKNISKKNKQAKIKGYLLGEMVDGMEIIIGLKRDPQFGPVVLLGWGGIYAEVFKDTVLRIAPFDLETAKKMITELKIYPLLTGARGQKPFDVDALAKVLEKFSQFVFENPQIKEIDLNPVKVLSAGQGIKIVDTRIIL